MLPSGIPWRIAGDRSLIPLKVPESSGRSGTCTELLPGALTTTENVPETGPFPSTEVPPAETESVPVPVTVHVCAVGFETSAFIGHRGDPSGAKPMRTAT